jgi:predicted transcriptional regulator
MKAEPVKVKNITIRIRDLKEALDEAKEVMKKLERGKKVEKHDGITFESLEAMRKVLTGERLKILKTIRKERPASIYELAKLVGRDRKNTFDDVQYLAQVGLVDLKKTKDGREKTTPRVNYERILLEIPV